MRASDQAAASAGARISPPPVLRPLEGAAPEPAASGASFLLGGGIAAAGTAIIDGVALAHQRFAEIGHRSGRADRECTAIAVAALRPARHIVPRGQRRKPFLGRAPAGPFARLAVAAGLRQFRCIDTGKPDLFVSGAQGIAIDHGDAQDAGRTRRAGILPRSEEERAAADDRGEDEQAG